MNQDADAERHEDHVTERQVHDELGVATMIPILPKKVRCIASGWGCWMM
jgi:hypothetical protein